MTAPAMRGRALAFTYVVVVGTLAVLQVVEPSGAALAALVLLTFPSSLLAYIVLLQAYYLILVYFASPAEPAVWLSIALVVPVWLGAALGQLHLARTLGRWWTGRTRAADRVDP